MPVLVTSIVVDKTFIGPQGLKRKVLSIENNMVKFRVTDIGKKPPISYKLMQEYECGLAQFANWAVSEV